LVRLAYPLEVSGLRLHEPVQALFEADQYLLDWRIILKVLGFLLNDLFDDLLRLLNVVCLAQISDNAIIRIEIDFSLLFDAVLGPLVLFE
jgi:hypothetical protein